MVILVCWGSKVSADGQNIPDMMNNIQVMNDSVCDAESEPFEQLTSPPAVLTRLPSTHSQSSFILCVGCVNKSMDSVSPWRQESLSFSRRVSHSRNRTLLHCQHQTSQWGRTIRLCSPPGQKLSHTKGVLNMLVVILCSSLENTTGCVSLFDCTLPKLSSPRRSSQVVQLSSAHVVWSQK